MRYRHPLVLLLVVAVACGIYASVQLNAAEEPKAKEPVVKAPVAHELVAANPKETAIFMRAKLTSSQKVVEGLVSKDFDLIATGAKELEKMSDAAAFQQYPDPVYRHYSREFRRQAAKLQRLGVDRNLEGASFTYMHSLTTCIACHEYVRDVIKVAEADDLDQPKRDENVRPAVSRQ